MITTSSRFYQSPSLPFHTLEYFVVCLRACCASTCRHASIGSEHEWRPSKRTQRTRVRQARMQATSNETVSSGSRMAPSSWSLVGSVSWSTGGPLVDHSPVFKDMLSLPQPAATQVEPACPVIPLPDSPADLRHVLRVLMPTKRIR